MCFLDAKKFKVVRLTDLYAVSNPDMGGFRKFQAFEISNLESETGQFDGTRDWNSGRLRNEFRRGSVCASTSKLLAVGLVASRLALMSSAVWRFCNASGLLPSTASS